MTVTLTPAELDALRSAPAPCAKLYIALKARADANGLIEVNSTTLAHEQRMPVASARIALTDLTQLGLIARLKRTARGTPNVYRIEAGR